jgi:hypothetical protein
MNNKQYILESIFSSDENMNLAFKNFLLNTINVSISNNTEEVSSYLSNPNMDNVIEKPGAIKLLDMLLELLPQDVSKSWLKMVYYLELWENIATESNPILMAYLFKREMISKLIDFFLSERQSAL